MRLRPATPTQPIPDVQTTSQKWNPDPELIIKHDDLYATVWETEYETPTLDKREHEPDSDNSPEITVRHDLPNDETRTIPGTIRGDSARTLPYINEIGDGTDTDHNMEPDAETSSEQLSPTNINPCSTKYYLRYNAKPNCNDDHR